MEFDFTQRMAQDAALVQEALGGLFRGDARYAALQEAMEYSLLAGGKRVRPVLTLETCRMCGGEPEAALPFACAVEMVHTYSLIHDDLPAMDNDSLRRGRPTNHIVYGEATAILAGDGLLTAAFGCLAEAALPGERIAAAVRCLSQAAGPAGMVGGQALDIAGEGRSMDLGELELLQRLKTGALIAAAAELGCIAAGGTQEQRERVRQYAQALGRAFQVRDDMLDVIADQSEFGKPVGSDRQEGKRTFVDLLDLAGCQWMVAEETRLAREAAAALPEGGFLLALADALADRRT